VKLIALQECWHNGTVPPKTIAIGEVFDMPTDAALSLIRIGAAKEADAVDVDAEVTEPALAPEPEVKPTRKRKSNEES